MTDTPLNSQIVQSVVDVNGINNLIAPSQSVAMLETVMAETLGMAMHNAVSRQQGAGMIGSASVAAVCAKLVGAPFGPFASPPIPEPPHIDPLPPVPPEPFSPAGIIAEASVGAAEAVELLRVEAGMDQPYASMAKAMLTQIAEEAGAPVPPPPDLEPTTLEEVMDQAAAANQAVDRLVAEAAPGKPNAEVANTVLQAIGAGPPANASTAASSRAGTSAASPASTAGQDSLDAILADSVVAAEMISRLEADAAGPFAGPAATALEAIRAKAKAAPAPAVQATSACPRAEPRRGAGGRAGSRKPRRKP